MELKSMRLVTASLATALLVCFAPASGNLMAEDRIEAKVVKYPELAKTVRDLKGKVVVVDLWSFY